LQQIIKNRHRRSVLDPDSLIYSVCSPKSGSQHIKEIIMAKAYWISAYRSISNPEALAAYAKLAGPALTAAGGKFLARNEAAAVKEDGLKQRTVLLEFDSVDAALAAYNSPAYQEAVRALGTGSVERDIRIVEGV
jgi:uncharacterized protein (DUF1330 family)